MVVLCSMFIMLIIICVMLFVISEVGVRCVSSRWLMVLCMFIDVVFSSLDVII